MSLLFRNLQTIVRFNMNKMRRDVELIRSIMKIRNFDVSVSCVDNGTIRGLNKRYRNTDETTDVLSFPFFSVSEPMDPSDEEQTRRAQEEAAKDDPTLYVFAADLGDIYLGFPYIRDRCRRTGFPLEDEAVVLTNHGFAHLLGYDHEPSLEDFKRMYLFEFNILAQFDRIAGRNTRKVKEAILENTYPKEVVYSHQLARRRHCFSHTHRTISFCGCIVIVEAASLKDVMEDLDFLNRDEVVAGKILLRKLRHAEPALDLSAVDWEPCFDRTRSSHYCQHDGQCQQKFLPLPRTRSEHKLKLHVQIRCLCTEGYAGERCERSADSMAKQ